jgi:acetyltransferase
VIRRQQARDRGLIDELMRGLSPSARFRRFHATMSELPPALLERLSQVDRPGEAAFLATTTARGREVAVGEARYAPSVEDSAKREFAIVVSEPWQRMGLGTALLSALVQHATRREATLLYGDTFLDNVAMIALARRLGFDCTRHPGDPALLRTSIRLSGGQTEIHTR